MNTYKVTYGNILPLVAGEKYPIKFNQIYVYTVKNTNTQSNETLQC